MRRINKIGNGGYHLQLANQNPPTTSKAATSRWKSFAHTDKVQESLLSEQYQLCCYSEIRADEEGLGYHIEHIENKRQNPSRTFDYSNLAASAISSAYGISKLKSQGQAIFGGHAPAKQANCDMLLFISCHQADCSLYFNYLSDGRVIPNPTMSQAEIAKAQYTIDTINLNSPYLITRRRQWHDELDKLWDEHTEKEWSIEIWSELELLPRDNKLNRFFSLTRQYFGQIAIDTLTAKAPYLL
ncbi:retron system putative HNH endonuclease [Pseudomonas tohonis]|uniref:retron system putative HNH endonuclease n=1 Tax=Pseudomonas tohonis TaxID=2725477 RepID=UPI0022F06923|nr:retron system putative HNH endonuclease [Pseudomonas tohonis]